MTQDFDRFDLQFKNGNLEESNRQLQEVLEAFRTENRELREELREEVGRLRVVRTKAQAVVDREVKIDVWDKIRELRETLSLPYPTPTTEAPSDECGTATQSSLSCNEFARGRMCQLREGHAGECRPTLTPTEDAGPGD